MMRKAEAAQSGAHVFQVALPSTSARLIATGLLLGSGSSVLPPAHATSAGTTGGISSSSRALTALQRSRWIYSWHNDEQHHQRSLLSPLTTGLSPPRGIGSSSSSSSNGSRNSAILAMDRAAWVTATTTRGGGVFRRHRNSHNGDGGDDSPVENSAAKGGMGEANYNETGHAVSDGFAVAAGTTGGGSSSGAADEEKEQGQTIGVEDGARESERGGEDAGNQGDVSSCEGDSDDNDGDSVEDTRTGSTDGEEEEVEEEEEGEEEEEEEEAGDRDEEGTRSVEAQATPPSAKRGPVAPLFSFPPGPRVQRTEAEESLQEVLPMQQRLVKYLTEDRIFGVQILCSIYFFMNAVAYSVDSVKYRRGYQAALAALTMKQWGTVLGRVRRVLVPHLLYEPQRYMKYRARVSALALDPAIQGIVYCAIFMMMPLGHALVPLLLKESVYLLWVLKEVFQLAAPGLMAALTSLFEPVMSLFMMAGDRKNWRDTPAGDKRLVLGRRLAQVCFKLEMVMPFSVALGVLPGAIQAALEKTGSEPEGEGTKGGPLAAAGATFAGAGGLVKVSILMMVYVKLLMVKNAQLEDDVRVLKGLKIRGYSCDWVEQVVDSIVFGKMVGCPWWAGLLASVFALLPNHEATKTVMASDYKLKTLGMTLLNFAIGRTPGVGDEDDDNDKDDGEDGEKSDDSRGKQQPGPLQSRVAKIAKIVAVASGVADS